MIRVKNKDASLNFYQDVMGMKLKRTSENPSAKFDLYFLGYGDDACAQTANGVNPLANTEGLLELTWNYGTENDTEFKYHNGNDEPQGFGHICITVDDLDAACARFEEKKVNWKKKLTDGRMKNIAFVLDPDNYWIEVRDTQSCTHARNILTQVPLDTGRPKRETEDTQQLVKPGCCSHGNAASIPLCGTKLPIRPRHYSCSHPRDTSHAHHSAVTERRCP